MPISLPPLAEQRRIVAEAKRRLSVVREMEAALAANLARSERLRQSILERAFEGKLVPRDPSDESAALLVERIRRQRTAVQNRQPDGNRGDVAPTRTEAIYGKRSRQQRN